MPSAIVLEQKKQVVADLTERLNGSIAGVILLAGGIIFLIVYKKRKKEN